MTDENTDQLQEPESEPQQPESDAEPKTEPKPVQTYEPDAYRAVLEQKDAQINALIEQTNSLTKQITKMINSGMQIIDGVPEQQTQQHAAQSGYGFAKGNVQLSDDDDYSVSALGSLIGKRDV